MFRSGASAGSITLGSHIQKEYLLISQSMTWDEAQKYCRDYHTDLATIQGLDDMKTLSSIAAARRITSMIWIGLREYGVKSWKWSSGDNLGKADYANWASLPTSSQNCGALRDDGKWLSAACNAALPFVCQTGECHISFSRISNQDKKKCNNLIIFSSETKNHDFSGAVRFPLGW